MRIARGDVRWIGDDRVVALFGTSLNQSDVNVIAKTLRARCAGRGLPPLPKCRRREPWRRPLAGNGKRDRAGTAAEIEDVGVLVRIDTHQRKLYQKLGFRARDQHFGRNFQVQSVELAPADEIRNRLAVATPPGERVECPRVAGAHLFLGVSGKPRAIATQHVTQQDLCFERNEAAGSERARDDRR